MKKWMKKSAGFTLIELLVIIAIIGLVSSVALANISAARERAQLAASLQQESSIRSAVGDTMVGEWKFDEGSGQTAQDSSGNGNDGEIVGGVFVEPGSNGSGYALYLPGGNSYVSGENIASDYNSNTTITAWVNPETITNARSVFNSGYGDSCLNYSLALASGSFIPRTANFLPVFGEEGEEGGAFIPNNKWSFVAATFSQSGQVDIYVNGSLADTVSGVPTENPCNTTVWTIGARANDETVTSSTENFAGLIDNVRVYSGGGSPFGAVDIKRIYAEELDKIIIANIQK